jgi:hypothetical protein
MGLDTTTRCRVYRLPRLSGKVNSTCPAQKGNMTLARTLSCHASFSLPCCASAPIVCAHRKFYLIFWRGLSSLPLKSAWLLALGSVNAVQSVHVSKDLRLRVSAKHLFKSQALASRPHRHSLWRAKREHLGSPNFRKSRFASDALCNDYRETLDREASCSW